MPNQYADEGATGNTCHEILKAAGIKQTGSGSTSWESGTWDHHPKWEKAGGLNITGFPVVSSNVRDFREAGYVNGMMLTATENRHRRSRLCVTASPRI